MKLSLIKKLFVLILALGFIIPITSTVAKVRAENVQETHYVQVLEDENSQEESTKEEKSLLWLMILLSITFIVLCFVVFIVLDYKFKKCRDGQIGFGVGLFPLLALAYPVSHVVGVVVLVLLNGLAITALVISIKHDFSKKKKPNTEDIKE